jgi:hypothetical protein
MKTKTIRVREAARIKDCTPRTVYLAVRAGTIDGTEVLGMQAVLDNKRFQEWKPKRINLRVVT